MQGRIVAIVPVAQRRPRLSRRATHVALPRHVLIPGLVNAHTHAAMTLFRGIADDVRSTAWLEQHIWPREAQVRRARISSTTARASPPPRCCTAASPAATTCISFRTRPPRAASRRGMRAMLGLPVLDFPTPYAADPDGLSAERDSRCATPSGTQPLLSFSLAPHAPYTVGDARVGKDRHVRAATRSADPDASRRNAPTEVAQSVERHGRDAARAAAPSGATGPGFIAIHAVHLDAGGHRRCSPRTAATSCTARRRT